MDRIITNVIALFDERIVFTCDDGIIYIYIFFERGERL